MDFMSATECPACEGQRLSLQPGCPGEGNFHRRFHRMFAIARLSSWCSWRLRIARTRLVGRVIEEIGNRLEFLRAVGLEYLSLSRSSASLSGGEAQRIRLATQIGSKLRGVLYVLDEPSIGLHARDNDRLIDTLHQLRDLGNTVLVVEHDAETIERADYVIDLGPQAGRLGGNLIAQGTPRQITEEPKSITGRYLSGKERIATPQVRRVGNGHKLVMKGATHNNLKDVDAEFPLGTLIVVTGVSGSGKSTLINDTLYRILAKNIYGSRHRSRTHTGRFSDSNILIK